MLDAVHAVDEPLRTPEPAGSRANRTAEREHEPDPDRTVRGACGLARLEVREMRASSARTHSSSRPTRAALVASSSRSSAESGSSRSASLRSEWASSQRLSA